MSTRLQNYSTAVAVISCNKFVACFQLLFHYLGVQKSHTHFTIHCVPKNMYKRSVSETFTCYLNVFVTKRCKNFTFAEC